MLFNVKFSKYLKYKHEVKKQKLIVYFKVKKILILCVHGEVVMLKQVIRSCWSAFLSGVSGIAEMF